MAEVKREKTMNVSARSLYRAITDFEGYPSFLSEVVSAKPEAPKGGKQRVTFELEVIKRFTYTLEFEMKENSEVTWHLVESNFFKNNDGKWKLTPKGDHSVDVVYELKVGFGFLVPGWVAKKLTETSLPKMFDSFERRAIELEDQ